MEKRVETNSSQKIISTKLSTNYSFIFQSGELRGILVEAPIESKIYYFDSVEEEPKVTDAILEEALKELLSSNPMGFDILACCFLGKESDNKKFNTAVRVFKEHWNKLYNLVIADDVFGRRHSLADINDVKTYDFFKKE